MDVAETSTPPPTATVDDPPAPLDVEDSKAGDKTVPARGTARKKSKMKARKKKAKATGRERAGGVHGIITHGHTAGEKDAAPKENKPAPSPHSSDL